MDSGQNNFPVARIGEHADLLQDLLRRYTAAQAAGRGDDAVGAGIITAFLNLQKRPCMPGQRSRPENRNSTLSLHIADSNPDFTIFGKGDEAKQIVQTIEAD